MDRRSFIERVMALAGVNVVAPYVQASTAKQVELQQSPVAGFQYHQGEKVWSLLKIGAPLVLVREPDNAYDPRAVRVDWHGRRLGYVPRVENASVSHLLDCNRKLSAEITALHLGHDPWERIEFTIYLHV
jgi:hypothetical protein